MKRRIAFIALVIILFCTTYGIASSALQAEADHQRYPVWVLCLDGYVNARYVPQKHGDVIGFLDAGDKLETDGTIKNGFVKVYGGFESEYAWVHCQYLTGEEPEWLDVDGMIVSDGRVAARKAIDGQRKAWVVNGSPVHVYWMTDTWATTNKGFIQSQYIYMGER